MDHSTLFILLACLFGLLMTWGVGANDLANVMSTTMGSKAISVRQAIIIAIIFEFAGAFLAGGQVTSTIRSGIIDTSSLANQPNLLVYGMLAVLLAGSSWMALASYFGLPVSITHTIIGSIVGFGLMVAGIHGVQWHMVLPIALSWLTSPFIAGIFGFLLFLSVQRLVLISAHPLRNAKRYVPVCMFVICFILSSDAVLRGIHHITTVNVSDGLGVLLALIIAILLTIIGTVVTSRIKLPADSNRKTQFYYVEKVFSVLMLFTAAAMVFAHGSNDVANAVGPMAVVVTMAQSGEKAISQASALPLWILFLGCSGVVIGLLMYGKKVITTVGSSITALTPSRAFAATFAAALTVVAATATGIPVSATQTLVGGVLGVGLARGIGALNLYVIRNIFMSWIITIPAGAILTIIYFNLFKHLFASL